MDNNFFDNLGPTYTEVMDEGELLESTIVDNIETQWWFYDGVVYTMKWDKTNGHNLMFTDDCDTHSTKTGEEVRLCDILNKHLPINSAQFREFVVSIGS